MKINQKGEIVTIAIVATFIILSIATIATSVITQNTDRAQVTSSRAADACKPEDKGKPKGHYCEYTSNNFGNPPYCVNVKWGNNCEDVYVRDDSIAGCCTAPTSAPIDTSGSCKIGKACGVDACNDTVTLANGQKGNSRNCALCNGGWCAGGVCATCGNQTNNSQQQQQDAAQQQRPQPTSAPQPTTAAQPTSAPQPTVPPSTGGNNGGNPNTGGGQQPAPTAATGQTVSCARPYPFKNRNLCNECGTNQTCKQDTTGKSCWGCFSTGPTPAPNQGSCRILLRALDATTGGFLLNVDVVVLSPKKTEYLRIETARDFVNTGIDYTPGESITIQTSKTGYTTAINKVTIASSILDKQLYGMDNVCNYVVPQLKADTVASPTTTRCAAPQMDSSSCSGICPPDECISTTTIGRTCYLCKNSGNQLLYTPVPTAAPTTKPPEPTPAPGQCRDSCFSSKPDGYTEVSDKVCSNGGTCYRKDAGIVAMEVKNTTEHRLTITKVCITDSIGLCIFDPEGYIYPDVTMKANGGVYVNSSMLTWYCSRFGKSQPDGYVWVAVKDIDKNPLLTGNTFGGYLPFTCGTSQDTFVLLFQ